MLTNLPAHENRRAFTPLAYAILSLSLMLVLGACTNGELTIRDPWARSALAGNNSAVYFVIENRRENDDTLLGASASIAETVEMHMTMAVDPQASEGEMEHDDGMDASEDGPQAQAMRMVKQDSVPVPAGGTVRFEPGGLHVMLINVQRDLNPGDRIQVTLQFQHGGTITLEAPVEQP